MSELAALVAAATAGAVAPVEAAAATRPYVALRTGSRWYAVPAAGVGEVVALPAVTRVPAAPAHVLGLAMLRARLVPVIDLELLVTGRPTPRLERGRAVVAHAGEVELALVAVSTRGLLNLVDGDAVAAAADRPPWVAREVATSDTLYAVIDVARLIAHALAGAA